MWLDSKRMWTSNQFRVQAPTSIRPSATSVWYPALLARMQYPGVIESIPQKSPGIYEDKETYLLPIFFLKWVILDRLFHILHYPIFISSSPNLQAPHHLISCITSFPSHFCRTRNSIHLKNKTQCKNINFSRLASFPDLIAYLTVKQLMLHFSKRWAWTTTSIPSLWEWESDFGINTCNLIL